jgi:hypothetical protein
MNIFDEDTPKDVGERIKRLCDEAGLTKDRDLVLDLYVLCSSKNPITKTDEDLLEGLVSADPKYWEERVEVTKRKEFLESLCLSPYVTTARTLGDPMKAVLVLIQSLKARQAALAALQGKEAVSFRSRHLIGGPDSEAGEEFLNAVQSEGSALAAQHDCDEFMKAIEDVTDIFQEGLASAFFLGCGMGMSAAFTSTPGTVLAREVLQHAQSLSPAVHAFFKLFTAECNIIGSGNITSKASPEITNDRNRDNMEDYSEVVSADPTELARDGFVEKLAQKKLEVDHYKAPEIGKCHVYVLLDVTGSMMTNDIGDPQICRAFAANVITLALLNLTADEGWAVHVLPFTGSVNTSKALHATDKASALQAANLLGTFQYDGGNTNIERAVMHAYRDLLNDPNYKKCDIVLLTDGFSPISHGIKTHKPPRVKLRTLIIGDEEYGVHSKNLREASDSYEILGWDKRAQAFTTGSALEGINKRESNG